MKLEDLIKQAENGNTEAQIELGIKLIVEREESTITIETLTKYLKEASEKGKNKADLLLYALFSITKWKEIIDTEEKAGVITNTTKIFYTENPFLYLIKSAKNGNAEAKFILGLEILRNLKLENEEETLNSFSKEDAFRFITDSANDGNLEAKDYLKKIEN